MRNDALCRALGLVGEHRERISRALELFKELRDARIDLRVLGAVLRIIRKVERKHLLKQRLRRSLGNGLKHEIANAVSDARLIIPRRHRRHPEPAERGVRALAKVGNRIQQRAVKIKHNGTDVAACLHQTPSLLRRMSSASSGVNLLS